jgi:hypothetical protein
MSRQVSVEYIGDEVIIRKHNNSPVAEEAVAALRRAFEGMNKNTDETTAHACDADELDEEDEEEPSRRERERRRQQLAENVHERGRLESTRPSLTVPKRSTKGDTPMPDPEFIISKICEAGLGFTVVKHYVERQGGDDDLTEGQVTDLLLGAWGAEFGKRFQAQDEEGRIAREAVSKAKQAGWINAHKSSAASSDPSVRAAGGREALATGRGSQGARRTEADKLRDQTGGAAVAHFGGTGRVRR